jgi:hypothetical protein
MPTSNAIFYYESTWIVIPHINSVEYDETKCVIYVKLNGDKVTLKFANKVQLDQALTVLRQRIEEYYS